MKKVIHISTGVNTVITKTIDKDFVEILIDNAFKVVSIVDILRDNTIECRERLFKIYNNKTKE